jgi:hypothetical protein
MSGNRSPDYLRTSVKSELSFTKSLLIVGAARALRFLIGDPTMPDKEDKPFGESQSHQERMQAQAREPGRGRHAKPD